MGNFFRQTANRVENRLNRTFGDDSSLRFRQFGAGSGSPSIGWTNQTAVRESKRFAIQDRDRIEAERQRGIINFFRALGGASPEGVNPTATAARSAKGSVVASSRRSGSRFVIPREQRRGLTASSFVISGGFGVSASRGLNLVI